ncbi:MAG: hypothetical protein RBT49_13805 [Bacteroidales bacterium]|jgi:hypothetical protein|nr:hypothetical protein [Bacteroidales bacterium]
MRTKKVIFLFVLSILLIRCTEDNGVTSTPFILLKTGDQYTINEAYVPVGGQLKFGISAAGDGFEITNLTVKRKTDAGSVTELDKGMFIKKGGLDTLLTYYKGYADKETWIFSIMNSNRDTASVSIIVNKGSGSAYGDIDFFPSITIGYQNNSTLPNYVDANSGQAYTNSTVAGNESLIDLVSYYYLSSGASSPTISCPSYNTAKSYYPVMNDWTVQNSTVYDYFTTDNNLISATEFDTAQNDSLLINGYKPESVSGTCKFCFAGKVIPFKTSQGKYGLLKVLHADEFDTGYIEIAIKIQK